MKLKAKIELYLKQNPYHFWCNPDTHFRVIILCITYVQGGGITVSDCLVFICIKVFSIVIGYCECIITHVYVTVALPGVAKVSRCRMPIT